MNKAFWHLLFLLFFLIGCSDEETSPLENEETFPIENEETESEIIGYWEIKSANVGVNVEIDVLNWMNMKLSITSSNIEAFGFPTETDAVWPDGIYTFNKKDGTIIRNDGIVMSYLKTGKGVDAFQVTFTIPDGIVSNINEIPLNDTYTFGFRRREFIDPSVDAGIYYKFNDFLVKYYRDKDNLAPGYPLEKCFEIVEMPICGKVHSKVSPYSPNLFIEVWCKQNNEIYFDDFSRTAIWNLIDTIPGNKDNKNILVKIDDPD